MPDGKCQDLGLMYVVKFSLLFFIYLLYEHDFKKFQINFERIEGIEPSSPAWKAGVIAFIRYPQFERKTGFEPATLTLAR